MLVKYPLRSLRRPARAVQPELLQDASLRTLIERMYTCMYQHQGVGLAGPQVAAPLAVVVTNITGKPEDFESEKTFLNLVIEEYGSESDVQEEGCLSFDGCRALVPRSKEIKVRYVDTEGRVMAGSANGLEARLLQHEFDHLCGRLIIDNAKEVTWSK